MIVKYILATLIFGGLDIMFSVDFYALKGAVLLDNGDYRSHTGHKTSRCHIM